MWVASQRHYKIIAIGHIQGPEKKTPPKEVGAKNKMLFI